MSAAFEHVFDSKEDSDVTFIVHTKELKAHQFILINRSPVFKAMIKGPMAPANQEHEITDPDIEFDDFNNLLKFLYTEKCEVTIENVQALLHLSDMYDVPSLSEFCVNTLSKTLSKENLLKFAEFGIIYENKFGIVTKCLQELSNKNVQTLQFQEENKMVWISSDLVIEFIKRSPRTPSFTETDVFRKVVDWAKGKCEEQNQKNHFENLKSTMAPFISYFELEEMDITYLTSSTVYDYELIPEKQLLKCYRDFILKLSPASRCYGQTSPSYSPTSPSYAPVPPVCYRSSPSYSPC